MNGHLSTGNRQVAGLAHKNSKKKKDYRLLGDNDGIKSRIELFRLGYHHFSPPTTKNYPLFHSNLSSGSKRPLWDIFLPCQGHRQRCSCNAFLQLLSAENSCCLLRCTAAASRQEAGQSLPALPADRCPVGAQPPSGQLSTAAAVLPVLLSVHSTGTVGV